MRFTPQILKSAYTFNDILKSAKDWFSSLDDSKKTSLKEVLEHGAGHLTTGAWRVMIGQSPAERAVANIRGIIWGIGGESLILR